MVFGSRRVRAAAKKDTWWLGSKTIEVVDKYKSLGAKVVATGSKWKPTIDACVSKGTSYVNNLLWCGYGAWGYRPRTFRTLWHTEGRAKMEYACQLWEGELTEQDLDRMESVQYNFCKRTLGLKGNPAAVGVRIELGLAKLQLRREALKLLYWEHLCNAPRNRLLSVVFRLRVKETKQSKAKYSWCQGMRSIMHKWGLLRFWEGEHATSAEDWKAYIWAHYDRMVEQDDVAELATKRSMALYQTIRPEQGTVAGCLDNRANRVGSRLQTQLRLGIAPLTARLIGLLGGQPSAALCPVCRQDAPEDVQHLLWGCPEFTEERDALQARIEHVLAQAGPAGAQARDKLRDRAVVQQVILGALIPLEVPSGSKREQQKFKESGAKILWAIDKIVKNFLLVVWKKRSAIAGTFTIEGRELKAILPDARHRRWLQNYRQRKTHALTLNIHDRKLRHFWTLWLRHFKKITTRSYEKKSTKNFYHVWRGHREGLFYKWSDCLESIRGFPGPKFKGFMSWDKAVNFDPSDVDE